MLLILGKEIIINVVNLCFINDGVLFIIICFKKYLEYVKKKFKVKIINICMIGIDVILSLILVI